MTTHEPVTIVEEDNILNEERDSAFASWSIGRSIQESSKAKEAWDASWAAAMDLSAKCLQLVDAGYKGGKLQ